MTAFNYQDAIRRFQEAQTAANNANESRYQGILTTLDNSGKTARTRASRASSEGNAEDAQSLISRGLYNTGTLDAARRGRARDLEDQNESIDEQVSNQRAGVMERRTDQGPDQGIYAQLLQQQGAAQAVANPQRTQTTVGAGPGGGGGRGSGATSRGGGGSPGFGASSGGGPGSFGGGLTSGGASYNAGSIYGPQWGNLPDPDSLRGGGRVDAVEGQNYGRINLGGAPNAARTALRRMVPGYSNSIGG